MSWVLLSILGALTISIVNIVDKYILTKWVNKPIIPTLILGIIGLITSILIYFFHGFSSLSYTNIVLSFLVGNLTVLAVIFYFMSVRLAEISRIIPIFQMGSVFVIIFATIFLKEIFTPIKYLGIFLLISGAVLISSENLKKFNVGKSFWLMILTALLSSISTVTVKYLLNFADFWTIFSYARIGMIFSLIPIFFFNFRDFISLTQEQYGKKAVVIISLNETLTVVAVLFTTHAIEIGYITLVNALFSLQPFFVLVFSLILSIFYPEIMKEDVMKSVVLQKFIAIVLMFTGVVLIT